MRTKTLTFIFLLAAPALSWANGCWNPNTQRWQWCPDNPYQESSNGLYGTAAEISRQNANAADNLARQRLEQERLNLEASQAAQENLRRIRQSRAKRYSDSEE